MYVHIYVLLLNIIRYFRRNVLFVIFYNFCLIKSEKIVKEWISTSISTFSKYFVEIYDNILWKNSK